MTILQVNDFYEFGGAENVMMQLSGLLTARGYEIFLPLGKGSMHTKPVE
jgi:hypothetical protein